MPNKVAIQVQDRDKYLHNLQVLRALDQKVNEIQFTGSHVVVYTQNDDDESWEKKDIEGSLFLVRRYCFIYI